MRRAEPGRHHSGYGKNQKTHIGQEGAVMLLELHVRNLALIERADVEFGDGLEILTGET